MGASGLFDFSTRIKGGGRKRPPPAHKAPQCGAFLAFGLGGRNVPFHTFEVVAVGKTPTVPGDPAVSKTVDP